MWGVAKIKMGGIIMKKLKSILTHILIAVLLFAISFPTLAENELILGDANGDKSVNTADAMVILFHITGKIELSESRLAAADINQDGKVNTGDASLVLLRQVKDYFDYQAYQLYVSHDTTPREWIAEDWFNRYRENNADRSGLIMVIEDADTLQALVDTEVCRLRVQECERHGYTYSGTPIFPIMNLVDVTKPYDEAFFKDNILVFANLYEATDSETIDVQDVGLKGSTLEIAVNQYNYPLVAAVDGNKLIILELSKKQFSNIESIEFTLNHFVITPNE